MADYQFWTENAKLVVPLGDYSAGTLISDNIWPEPGTWEQFQINVWVSNATGVSIGWISFLETSSDSGSTWTAVPGSATAALAGPGSRSSNAQVPPSTLVRVKTTISGVGVTITGRAYVLATPVLG